MAEEFEVSFDGPTGQIAILHEELAGKRNWISEFIFFLVRFGRDARLIV